MSKSSRQSAQTKAHGSVSRKHPNTHYERGSAYILVLGTSLVLMVTGLAAVMALRVERRVTTSTTNFHAARLHAQSAIEVGYQLMRDDPNWRTNRQNGSWIQNAPIGQGTYTLQVTDPDDGDLLNTPNNFIDMTGTGTDGGSTFKLTVKLTVVGAGLEVVPESWKQVVN